MRAPATVISVENAERTPIDALACLACPSAVRQNGLERTVDAFVRLLAGEQLPVGSIAEPTGPACFRIELS